MVKGVLLGVGERRCSWGEAGAGGRCFWAGLKARLGMLEVRLITRKSEERQSFLSWDSKVKVQTGDQKQSLTNH